MEIPIVEKRVSMEYFELWMDQLMIDNRIRSWVVLGPFWQLRIVSATISSSNKTSLHVLFSSLA